MTKMSIADGWLTPVRRCPSPNQDDRPDGEISLVVIHNISLPPGRFGTGHIDALFTNRLDPGAHPYFTTIAGLRVSAHLLIDRHGDLTQYVPFHRRAWHAGRSRFRGRERCNDFSIGIELEGCDDVPYEAIQYRRLAQIVRLLLDHYPDLSPDKITGHSDIAPDRKTDPGPAFDWAWFRCCLERC